MGKEQNTAVKVKAFDAEKWAEKITVEQEAIPEPGKGQALVQIYLRPVNPSDVLSVQGIYGGFQPTSLPAVPGMEGVGKIVKSSGKFNEGQRVVGRPWPASKGHGTYQEYYVADEDVLVAVPDKVSDEQAASYWINPVTAVGMLKELNAPKGGWIVQGAAGGHLGRQIIQVAKHYGVKTVNIVRRSAQKQEILDLGGDAVISTEETDDLTAKILEITGEDGAWGALDPIAGETTGKFLAAVRDNGKVLVYGVLSGLSFSGAVPDLLFKGKVVQGFWLVPWYANLDKKGKDELVQETFHLLGNKIIEEFKGETFPLKDVVKALEHTNKPGRGGKVYLTN